MTHPNETATPAKADPTKGHTPTPWKISNGLKGVLGDAESMKPAIFIHGPPMFPSGNCPDLQTVFERVDPSALERANAALIVRAVNNHDPLIDELTKAHRIIRNALNIMSDQQKFLWGSKNAADECDGEGTTRAHEREAVIDAANGEA